MMMYIFALFNIVEAWFINPISPIAKKLCCYHIEIVHGFH